MNRPLIVGIGELLWDMLPDGPMPGGAPANFAYHADRQGADGVVVSAVGDDSDGKAILEAVRGFGMATDFIQITNEAPTGKCLVTLVDDQPEYEIVQPSAWDFIHWTPELELLSQRSNAVCFGTLGQRGTVSGETIRKFLAALPPKCPRVLDLNLRQQFYSKELIHESLKLANILKLNEAEMTVCRKLLGLSGAAAEGAYTLIERYRLSAVILTKGAKGSSYYDKETCFDLPNRDGTADTVDTVGCGDAFTAAFLTARILGCDAFDAVSHAAEVAGYVACCPGATPEIPEELRITEDAE